MRCKWLKICIKLVRIPSLFFASISLAITVLLVHLANTKKISLEEKKNILENACKKSEKYTRLYGINPVASSLWASYLSQLADLETNPQKKYSLALSACEKIEEATTKLPERAGYWACWGASLHNLAILESDLDKVQALLKEARTKYEQSINIDPTNFAVRQHLAKIIDRLAVLAPEHNKKRE